MAIVVEAGRSTVFLARVGAAIAGLFLGGAAASAEEVDAGSDDRIIEEIIVTATFRETKLMNTPIAISVLEENVLIDKGVFDMRDMYLAVPGLSFRSNSSSYNAFTIRGLTAPSAGGSVVGVYVDDIPVTGSSLRQVSGTLYDVARVEVLKGPQGTLYGEGSMGGAVRYVTNRADPEALAARFNGQYSFTDDSDDPSYVVSGMVNVPLIDERLALRVSGQYRDRGGFIDTLADRNDEDVDYRKDASLRARIEWRVSDVLWVDGTINHHDGEYGGPGLATIPPSVTPYATALSSRNWDNQFDNQGEDNYTMYNVAVHWELPFAEFLSSTSYFDREAQHAEQTSPNFVGGLEGLVSLRLRTPAFGPVPNPLYEPTMPRGRIVEAVGGTGAFTQNFERVVQEFRLTSTTAGRWQWTAGLYFKDDETIGGDTSRPRFGFVVFPPFEPFLPQIHALFPGNETLLNTREVAAYGEASYAFNEQFELLLGLRAAQITADVEGVAIDIDETIVAPKATLTFRPNDSLMLYATVAQGFRPGVINTGVLSQIRSLEGIAGSPVADAQRAFLSDHLSTDADETTSYEIGIKGSLADGRVRVTGSIYYMDWKDMITQIVTPTILNPRFGYSANAGEAHTQGFEISVDFSPTEALTLHLGGDYIPEAEFDSVTLGGGLAQGTGGISTTPLVEGSRMAVAPEFSINAAVSYRFLVGSYPVHARLDWYKVDEQFNIAVNPIVTPGYDKLDGRLRFEDVGGWGISVFGQNLTNEIYAYEINRVGYNYGLPRTIGVGVERAF